MKAGVAAQFLGRVIGLAYHGPMKLSQSNRFLRSRPEADAALLVSAKTSSAVEGIRLPFTQNARLGSISDADTFTQRWKQRVASKSAR